jgi:hypothetical protein
MFGTELDSAYAPFGSDNAVLSPFLQDNPNVAMNMNQGPQRAQPSMEIVHKSTPIANLSQGPVTQVQPQFQSPIVTADPKMQGIQQPPTMMMEQFPAGTSKDAKIAILVNELKKQQRIAAHMQQQTSYLDKMFAKKKDVLKIIQFSLIIVLAMSIHFIIDYYIKFYIKNNDPTFERELIIRLIYPVSVIFIIWNLKTFLK